MSKTSSKANASSYVRRHLIFAWWSLLCFLTLGMTLEALHGFKVRWYLDTAYEARRLVWTLGHAHGTLLALVHIAFAVTIYVHPTGVANSLRVISPCLIAASILLPGGFFLGGIFVYAGDPGMGIFLVPFGALFLFIGVLLTAWKLT